MTKHKSKGFEFKKGLIPVGTKVKLRPDVLVRQSRSVPAHLGYSPEQFTWRDTLDKLEGKTGEVYNVFSDEDFVNIDFDGVKIGIKTSELLIKSGKGWKEAPDASGKAPRHKAAATRRKVAGVSKAPQVRKEKDWKKVAKKELERELEVKTKLSTYGNDDEFSLTLESTTGAGSNGESEWVIYKNEDEARSAAISQVRQDLDDSPENFTQSWLQKFIMISDTDKRIIAGEEADSRIEEMDDNELVKEAGTDEEWNDLEVKKDELIESDSEDIEAKLDELREKQDSLVEKAKDSLGSSKSDQIQDALDDPVEYFVEQQGIYSREDLMKQSFIRIDIDKAAEDAIDTDGISHFLDRYDGSELDLPSGAIAYGTN